jgi:hypothetical protein
MREVLRLNQFLRRTSMSRKVTALYTRTEPKAKDTP